MKIVVTFEREDIIELIKKHLNGEGMKYDLSSGKWKGNARFTVEVEGEVSVEADAAPAPTSSLPETPKAKPVPKEPPPPELPEPPVDIDDIRTRSLENSKRPGLYPGPTRTMMEGESADWPGSPEPRGR